MVSAPPQRNRAGAPAGRTLPPWPALGTPRRRHFGRRHARRARRNDGETRTRGLTKEHDLAFRKGGIAKHIPPSRRGNGASRFAMAPPALDVISPIIPFRALSHRRIASYRQLVHLRRIDPFGEGQWPSAPVCTIEGRGAYHDDL